MAFFVLIAIMVVDIAALISPANSLNTYGADRILTPSQVPLIKKQNREPPTAHLFLRDGMSAVIPSQVGGVVRSRKSSTTKMAASTSGEIQTDDSTNNNNHTNKTTKTTHPKNTTRNKKSTSGSDKPSAKQKRTKQRIGNLPDVLWRHIPLEHVRKHPLFDPLPSPDSIHHLESMEDVRYFRQESWQWDVLHEGRMTTSQAVAALGFMEPMAGEILGVPRGLRRGGEGAYYRLKRGASIRTLEEMNAKLCVSRDDYESTDYEENGDEDDDTSYWTQPPNFPFAAKHMMQITEEEYENRRQIAMNHATSQKNQWSIRMVWGNVQEATSLLTALNYFWKRDKRVRMKEIGMCGAGLEFNQTSTSTGLMLGATPDAVLCHPDGRIEAVEVKNHCPFVPNNNNRYNRKGGSKSKSKQSGAFRLSQQKLSKDGSIMCTYIPQLMMEMLCLGENCESAVMVRQTATSGSLILRVKRNNEWIEEMLYWLGRFHNDFVCHETPPPQNFFLKGDDPADEARYKKFLELTKRVESEVELLEHVPHKSVQRAIAKHSVPMDLFLD